MPSFLGKSLSSRKSNSTAKSFRSNASTIQQQNHFGSKPAPSICTYSDIYPPSSEVFSSISTGLHRNGTPLDTFRMAETPSDLNRRNIQEDSHTRDNSPCRDSPQSGDSGFADQLGICPIIERDELELTSEELIREIRTVAQLTEDFRKDVIRQTTHSIDLLDELEYKIRPYLIRLDEDITTQEEILRKNLDRCKITDKKVSWLLHYNQFMIEFRQMVQSLTLDIYEELEKVLRLRIRGCVSVEMKQQQVSRNLFKIVQTLDDMERRKTLNVF